MSLWRIVIWGLAMPEPAVLREYVKATIRAEKARANLTFGQLSALLKQHGIEQSATNLSTKVGRGGMSAQLFVAIMKVLGRSRIELGELELPNAQVGVAKPRSKGPRG
jgi:hypothetical protein